MQIGGVNMYLIKKIIRLIKYKLTGQIALDILVQRGLKIGKNFKIERGCIIDESFCWCITIGDDVTFAPNVHILAHDASTKTHLGYTKMGLVDIGDNVFIGAGSIVLLNTKIGKNVIIGSGSVVTKDIPPNVVAVGSPCKIICTTTEYLNKNKIAMKNRPIFKPNWVCSNQEKLEIKHNIIKMLQDGIGYV